MLDFSARKIFTIPNLLSAARIVAVPFIGWLLLIDSVPARLAAGALLIFAILTDYLDGWFARILDQASDLGRLIDPLADKLFIILLAIVLIFTRDFPLWLVLVIVGKDLLIVIASVLVVGRKRVVMESNIIGKYAFGFQAGLVVCYFLDFPFGELFFIAGSLILIAATLVSYFRSFLFVIRSTAAEVIVPTPPQIVPTWARRIILIVLLIIVITHMYYWTAENTAVALDPIDPQALPYSLVVALAEQYSPVLVFSNSDHMRPVSVEHYLTACDLHQGWRWLWGLTDSLVKAGPLRSADLRLAYSEDAYLAHHPAADFANSRPTLYAQAFYVGLGEEERIVLQFWMLFPSETALNGRQGDWQLAALYLDPDEQPLYLALTQGYYATVIPWSRVQLREGQPVIYVATGTHSLYPAAGLHPVFLDEEKIFSLSSESTSAGLELDSYDYDTEIIGSGGLQWWTWPGRWGGPLPGGDRGPRYWNPRNTDRAPWSYPLEFLKFYSK
jgi:cardiolipin synthase